MTCEREIKKGFPKFTRIEIIENDVGYYLKRKGVDEILDISFKNANEAIKYAISEHWIFITGIRYHTRNMLGMEFNNINNKSFQWGSGKTRLFTRFLHKYLLYPSNV